MKMAKEEQKLDFIQRVSPFLDVVRFLGNGSGECTYLMGKMMNEMWLFERVHDCRLMISVMSIYRIVWLVERLLRSQSVTVP